MLGNNAGSSGLTITDSINPPTASIAFYTDGSLSQDNQLASTVIGSTIVVPGNLTLVDTAPSVGNHTYKIRASVTSSTTNLTLKNLRLVAYEL
jgi:hypothetical protein